jgi:6-phosphogluconolactonase/glucosamine-6-phosphate isomerase/deaminase
MSNFTQRGLERVELIVAPEGVAAGTKMAHLFRPVIDARHARSLPTQVMLAVGRQQYAYFDEVLAMRRAGWTTVAGLNYCLQDDWEVNPDNPLSLVATAKRRFLDPLGVPAERIIYPTAANIGMYHNLIAQRGTLDVLLLGIGKKAHFAFANGGERNCLGEPIMKEADLPSRQANAELFGGILANVPTHVVTIRFNTLKMAGRIFLVMESEDYWEDAEASLFGPITPDVPCSLVRSLPKGKVTIIVGWKLAKYLRNKGHELPEALAA